MVERVGTWKSGSFGDTVDYLFLLRAIRERHPEAEITAFYSHVPSSLIFSSIDFITTTVPVEKGVPWEAESQFAHFLTQWDGFYDLRAYVGRKWTPLAGYLSPIKSEHLPIDSWDWDLEFRTYYENPTSIYQNILPDHFPKNTHLDITALSCDLPSVSYDPIDFPLPAIEIPKDKWVTISCGAAGSDKGARQTKMWGFREWQEVADALRHDGFEVVQTGVGFEAKLKGVRYWWNQPILRTLALLKASPLHLAVENGTVRLRKLVTDLPSVVLFGPTDSHFFGFPNNIAVTAACCRPCFWLTGEWMSQCPRALDSKSRELAQIWSHRINPSGPYDRICMRSITPEMVLRAIRSAFSEMPDG